MKDLNLIPKSYYVNKRKKEKKAIIVLASVLMSITAIGTVSFPVYYRSSLQKQFNKLQQEIDETTGYKVNQERLEDANLRYSNWEKEAKRLSQNSFSSIQLIDRIKSSMPKNLFISDLSFVNKDDGNVDILLVGSCAAEDDVVSFLYYLRKSSNFENVYISSVQKTVTAKEVKASLPVMGSSNNVKVKSVTKAKIKSVKTVKPNEAAATQQTVESYNFNISMNYLIK